MLPNRCQQHANLEQQLAGKIAEVGQLNNQPWCRQQSDPRTGALHAQAHAKARTQRQMSDHLRGHSFLPSSGLRRQTLQSVVPLCRTSNFIIGFTPRQFTILREILWVL